MEKWVEDTAIHMAKSLTPPDALISVPVLLFVAMSLVLVPLYATSLLYQRTKELELGALATMLGAVCAMFLCGLATAEPVLRLRVVRESIYGLVMLAYICGWAVVGLGVIVGVIGGVCVTTLWLFAEPARIAKFYAAASSAIIVYAWRAGYFD